MTYHKTGIVWNCMDLSINKTADICWFSVVMWVYWRVSPCLVTTNPLSVPRVTRGSPRQSTVIQVREGEQVRTILPWVFKVSFPMKIMWITWTNHKAGNNWITQFVLKKLMVCFEDELKRMSLTPQILTNLVGKHTCHGFFPTDWNPEHVIEQQQQHTEALSWPIAVFSKAFLTGLIRTLQSSNIAMENDPFIVDLHTITREYP